MAFAPTERTRGTAAVDAVDQDDAAGRGAGADLSVLSRRRSARHPDRAGLVSCASAICRSSCGCCSPISRKFPRTFSRRRAWTARRSARSSSIVLTPMAVPGIASTLLLNFILAWNEAFWTLNLDHAPMRRRSPRSSRPIRAPRGCSGPSCRRPRRSPSRPSWCSAGSASDNWSAASPSARSNKGQEPWAASSSMAFSKSFGVDRRSSRTSNLDDRRRVLRRLRRAVRLRQVDPAAADRRARGHDRRQDPDRRQRCRRGCRRPSAASRWCSSPMRSIRT